VNAPAVSSPATANDADLIRAKVQAAGSSFYWAMRFMPQAKREALFAVYAFCREVDDIADGDTVRSGKIVALDGWRQKIEALYTTGQASDPICRSLGHGIATYGLRKKDFIAVIQGMEMDARGPIVAPSLEELDLYCDCVAAAVGRLCVPIFGEATPAGERVANRLGRALQLTNILRDVEEDADIGRLYLPAEFLAREGVPAIPYAAVHSPNLPKVREALGRIAAQAYADTEAALADCAKGAMRPAVIMMMVYRKHLDRLEANKWRPLPPRTGLARARANIEKLWIAIHYGFF
jgi:squalene synthase HpnD